MHTVELLQHRRTTVVSTADARLPPCSAPSPNYFIVQALLHRTAHNLYATCRSLPHQRGSAAPLILAPRIPTVPLCFEPHPPCFSPSPHIPVWVCARVWTNSALEDTLCHIVDSLPMIRRPPTQSPPPPDSVARSHIHAQPRPGRPGCQELQAIRDPASLSQLSGTRPHSVDDARAAACSTTRTARS